MGQNEFLIFWWNYLEKIMHQYVTCVHGGESRACLYGQTGARKKNLVYNHRCTFDFYVMKFSCFFPILAMSCHGCTVFAYTRPPDASGRCVCCNNCFFWFVGGVIVVVLLLYWFGKIFVVIQREVSLDICLSQHCNNFYWRVILIIKKQLTTKSIKQMK